MQHLIIFLPLYIRMSVYLPAYLSFYLSAHLSVLPITVSCFDCLTAYLYLLQYETQIT